MQHLRTLHVKLLRGRLRSFREENLLSRQLLSRGPIPIHGECDGVVHVEVPVAVLDIRAILVGIALLGCVDCLRDGETFHVVVKSVSPTA
jgi:hypothetical protein